MKTASNGTITLEHVTRHHTLEVNSRQMVYLVQFDGEWDLWFSEDPHPSETEHQNCILELNKYYSRDWKDTGRLLPIRTYRQVDQGHINCM